MTQLQIVNLALAHLGQLAITQSELDNNSNPTAIAANAFWVPCRDEVLGESDWPFATVTQSLSALDNLSDSEWDFIYSYPTLTVSSIWNVFNDATIDDKAKQEFTVKFVIATGSLAIYSNLDDAIAEYTYKVTDPSIWSNKFVMAFSYRLAASMAIPVAGDAAKGLELRDIYNAILSEAKRLESSEKIKVPPQGSKYIDAR